MVLLITRRIWVKLSTVFILLLRRSENILTSRLLSRLLDLLSSIDSDWPRTDKKKSGGNWVAKCDVFIVSRIIFSLVFARGRNDYISFSINIGTNKLEHDPQDTRVRFFQIFSLRVPSRRRTCQHFEFNIRIGACEKGKKGIWQGAYLWYSIYERYIVKLRTQTPFGLYAEFWRQSPHPPDLWLHPMKRTNQSVSLEKSNHYVHHLNIPKQWSGYF